MKLGKQVGLSPGHIVLDGDPAPLSQSETGTAPLIFGSYLLRPNGCMDQDATWYGGRPRPRRLCVRWGPHSPPQKGAEPPKFSAHVNCGQTAGWIKVVLAIEVGLSPGDFVLDGHPAPSPKRGQSPPICPCLLRQTALWTGGIWHRGEPWSRPHCARWGPSSPRQKF